MLPLGRKNARRCTECGITCHANCAHLVPDFCGMSMETANQLLSEIQKVKATRTAAGRQTTRPARVPVPPAEYQQPPIDQDMRQSIEGLRTSMGDVQISPAEHSPTAQQRPLPPSQQYPQQPAAPAYPYSPGEAPPPPGRIPPGGRAPEPPMPYADPQSGRYQPPAPDAYLPGFPQVNNPYFSGETIDWCSNMVIIHTFSSSNRLLMPSHILPDLSQASPASHNSLQNASHQYLLLNSNFNSMRLVRLRGSGRWDLMISTSLQFWAKEISAK